MSKLGRWMCPHEVVTQTLLTMDRNVADFAPEEVARLEKFAEAICAVPEGGNIYMLVARDQDVIAAIGTALGVTVKVVA